MPYLGFSRAENAVLIANHGSYPSTIREAQHIARHRRSERMAGSKPKRIAVTAPGRRRFKVTSDFSEVSITRRNDV
jgi:hypothetical protein